MGPSHSDLVEPCVQKDEFNVGSLVDLLVSNCAYPFDQNPSDLVANLLEQLHHLSCALTYWQHGKKGRSVPKNSRSRGYKRVIFFFIFTFLHFWKAQSETFRTVKQTIVKGTKRTFLKLTNGCLRIWFSLLRTKSWTEGMFFVILLVLYLRRWLLQTAQ